MGTTASCNGCKCEEQSPTPTGTPSKMKRLSWEEELCNPEAKCRSWGAGPTSPKGKRIPLLAQKAAIELPHPGVARTASSRGRRGIDEEHRLHFGFKAGDKLGLQLAETQHEIAGRMLARLLVVVSVDVDSPFAKAKDGHTGLCPGDVLVEVNGRRGTAAEVWAFLQHVVTFGGNKTINLVVRPRPPAFYVEVLCERSDEKLGVAAVIDKGNPGCVLVQALRSEGLVPRWNDTHGSLQICAGDLITEVNGISQDAEAMCKEIQASSKGSLLRLRVLTSQYAAPQKPRLRQPKVPTSLRQPADEPPENVLAGISDDLRSEETESTIPGELENYENNNSNHDGKAVEAEEEHVRNLMGYLSTESTSWDTEHFITIETSVPLEEDTCNCAEGTGADRADDLSTENPCSSSGTHTPPLLSVSPTVSLTFEDYDE